METTPKYSVLHLVKLLITGAKDFYRLDWFCFVFACQSVRSVQAIRHLPIKLAARSIGIMGV